MPRLVIKKGEGVGRDHALGAGACVVGRDPSADFTLDDTLVSRHHFKVFQDTGAYWVEDMGSTNGTIVNGRKVQRAQLMDGDEIQVGGTQVTFVQKDLLSAGGVPAKKVRQPPVVQAPPAKSVPAKSVPAKPAAKPAAPDAPKRGTAPVRRRRRR